MNSKNFLSDLEVFFLALADKTRLKLLNLMREQEICVNLLVEILSESQPKISRHLAYLKSAGIVAARRDGKWIYYRINELADDYAAQVLSDTLEWLESQAEMRKDYEKLQDVYRLSNSRKVSAQIQNPNILAETNMKREKEELETFLL